MRLQQSSSILLPFQRPYLCSTPLLLGASSAAWRGVVGGFTRCCPASMPRCMLHGAVASDSDILLLYTLLGLPGRRAVRSHGAIFAIKWLRPQLQR
jgi:hypothetical protein